MCLMVDQLLWGHSSSYCEISGLKSIYINIYNSYQTTMQSEALISILPKCTIFFSNLLLKIYGKNNKKKTPEKILATILEHIVVW